ncbi:MAG TPA: TlpA disulfide reductase family protein [Acidimicrobiia bacterium]|nr:TlpA disulfide reductase family protein [Acidimicrobiia bacterium]
MLAALILSSCGSESIDVTQRADLPATSAEQFAAHLAALDRPAVVNVWASWCLPCRSEAPLLNQAHAEHGDVIEFIGVDVQDSQRGAKEFLAEFGLEFDHFFDRNRQVPNSYGGIGTPITMFFAPHGELVTIHNGVIDERTLAINIDELTGADE